MRNLEQVKSIISAFDAAYKTSEWKDVVKASTGYVGSDEAFDTYKGSIKKFNDGVYSSVKVRDDDFDIEEIDDLGTTKFGMTFVNPADVVAPSQEVKPEVDNLESSFIISKDDFDALNEKVEMPTAVIPSEKVEQVASVEEPVSETFTSAITPVIEEVEEIEETPKVLTKSKKAAYVDTVILCLIAQLSIFGLLIIVLLIIK